MAIHRRLYRRIEEPPARTPAVPALAIASYGSRYAVRGWFTRLVFYASFLPVVVFSVAVYVASQQEQIILRFYNELMADQVASFAEISPEAWRHMAAIAFFFLLEAQAWFVLMLNAFVGARLVADDLKSRALEIYLTRPIRAADYVLGKLLVVMRPLLVITWVPCLVLTAVGGFLLPGAFGAALPVVLRAFGAGAFLALVNGIVILGISATTANARYATVVWFVLYFFTMLIHGILLGAAGTAGAPFELVSYRANQEVVLMRVLGPVSPQLEADMPYLDAPILPSLSVLGALAAFMLWLVWRRLRPGKLV